MDIHAVDTFPPPATQALNTTSPTLITKLESQWLSGALNPRRQQCITVRLKEFICDAERWAVMVMSISRCITNYLRYLQKEEGHLTFKRQS
ncbi:type IV toxin-antitoxin system YeeU family antitoxin [Yersinia alsatica]|uniref:type IV toxin-antitoxin system YeeU family antitoxin n=1 Tax=Yersinia alsatica TaxID=2890317 RepID=UPI00296FA830|nr:type IV toxin-antitoxin system YeeU family antitoxin [Yersinia alsatica]